MSGRKGNGKPSLRGGRTPLLMQRQQRDPPVVPEWDPLTEEPREEPQEAPFGS